MLYSLLTMRTRFIPVTNTWGKGPNDSYTFDQEHRAYGETQYFTSLEKAKAFAEFYCPGLVWDQLDEYHTAEQGEISFQIQVLKTVLDPVEHPPLPEVLRAVESLGD